MPKNRRRFNRPPGERHYRKMFVIAVEGAKTEPQYFAIFNSQSSVIHVKCLKGRNQSSPGQVLKRMESHLKNETLRDGDEAWLVIDKDRWTDEQLNELFEWSEQGENYGFALSNPKFEFWLLLHFENGDGIRSSKDCSSRLSKHLPHYDKGINASRFPPQKIKDAIDRAERKDNPPCTDWPRTIGNSTVYKLIRKISES